MKYKIINSALFLNGKLIPEGSSIELTSVQTEGITAYLQPLESVHFEQVKVTNYKKQSNIKKEK